MRVWGSRGITCAAVRGVGRGIQRDNGSSQVSTADCISLGMGNRRATFRVRGRTKGVQGSSLARCMDVWLPFFNAWRAHWLRKGMTPFAVLPPLWLWPGNCFIRRWVACAPADIHLSGSMMALSKSRNVGRRGTRRFIPLGWDLGSDGVSAKQLLLLGAPFAERGILILPQAY